MTSVLDQRQIVDKARTHGWELPFQQYHPHIISQCNHTCCFLPW